MNQQDKFRYDNQEFPRPKKNTAMHCDMAGFNYLDSLADMVITQPWLERRVAIACYAELRIARGHLAVT